MANKDPNKPTRFKKGQSGNPQGRAKLLPEIKRIKKMTASELEILIDSLLRSNQATLVEIQKNPDEPFIKRIIVNILFNSFKTGNMAQLNMVLDRLIGKVKEKIDLTMTKPKILERRDGTEVVFSQTEIKEDEEIE